MLKVENLIKKFGKKVAVDDVSFELTAGDIFGFIGPNGAGKTTTIKMIVGILERDAGKVYIDGMDFDKHEIESKAKMAYIADNPELYDYLKGIEYLDFIAAVYNVGDEKDELIETYAKDLGIYENLGDPISSYSHGMSQKLALVSAFIRRPKILILDEPFVGLDPLATHKLKGYLKKHCEAGGIVLFSTHVLEVAEKICNKIGIIKDAKMIKMGNTNEITKDKSLENVFLELADE